jgi:DNA-binding transcriptional ArsR family regulator
MRAGRTGQRQEAAPIAPALLKALGHPLRQRLLSSLGTRTASPNELAKELGEPLGNVSYHVKVLADADAIELVRTVPVRGATEHFYRATKRPVLTEEAWSRLPAAARRTLGAQTFRQISQHVAEAADAGAFEEPKVHVSWTRLELDAEAYAELADELEALVNRALELHAESVDRARAGDDEQGVRPTELAILHFDRLRVEVRELLAR